MGYGGESDTPPYNPCIMFWNYMPNTQPGKLGKLTVCDIEHGPVEIVDLPNLKR